MSSFFLNGDLFSSIFSTPISDSEALIIVDGHVWNQIKDSLPEGYIIPDPRTMEVIQKSQP